MHTWLIYLQELYFVDFEFSWGWPLSSVVFQHVLHPNPLPPPSPPLLPAASPHSTACNSRQIRLKWTNKLTAESNFACCILSWGARSRCYRSSTASPETASPVHLEFRLYGLASPETASLACSTRRCAPAWRHITRPDLNFIRQSLDSVLIDAELGERSGQMTVLPKHLIRHLCRPTTVPINRGRQCALGNMASGTRHFRFGQSSHVSPRSRSYKPRPFPTSSRKHGAPACTGSC